MGIVYVAEQTVPVRRKVALKIIKPCMATKDAVARFEVERQALAMMDHPNIAKVHDGGATDSGQPYFVMATLGRCGRSQSNKTSVFMQIPRLFQPVIR